MEKIRPILYGVADYAQLRKKNAWFVDRTAKIRDLEDIAYAVFLRPRRFGKYSADPSLAAKWHLGTETGSDKSVASPKGATLGEAALSPLQKETTFGEAALSPLHNGTVALHRLVLVFHGGDCVLNEEV